MARDRYTCTPMSTTLRALPLILLAGIGCTSDSIVPGSDDFTKVDPLGKDDSSVEAIFVDMEFDGEMVTDSTFNLSSQIEDQLLYTIGHLNGDNSVGRLD